ncbi:BZ3501_MvSof-1269-A2-R1_Chr12-3g03546 [Microbotryum saponariae]|nr:BZ3501_MvSof-1269-A2-R1_Chr12-3g03546 [Microbotryum saponariae]
MTNMMVTFQKMVPAMQKMQTMFSFFGSQSGTSNTTPRLDPSTLGQSRRFTFAVCCPLFRPYVNDWSNPFKSGLDSFHILNSFLVYPSASSSTLSQSSSRASTTRHPAPAASMPDPALNRSTSSNARTSRSSPVHANDRNGARAQEIRFARPSPAKAMQLMPTSKEESRKGKGVQRFASGEQAEEEEDWGKSASVDRPGRRRRRSERG